jgi:hypothetical protein
MGQEGRARQRGKWNNETGVVAPQTRVGKQGKSIFVSLPHVDKHPRSTRKYWGITKPLIHINPGSR